MSIKLAEALERLTVPELKVLLGHVPGADTAGRKDQLLERIIAGMQGSGLQAIWARLDQTQQAAVAEAAHNPYGEYSQQRFEAKYQCLPSFEVEQGKSNGYSIRRKSALALFIHYVHDVRCHVVPADLRARLLNFVPQPAPLAIASSDTPADAAGLTLRLTEREAAQELVVMLRTLEHARVQVSEKTAVPGTAALRLLSEKLAGGDFYPWVEKNDKWDQEIGPIKAFAWPMLLQAGGLAIRAGGRLALNPAGVKALSAPPADVMRGLWRKWLNTTLLDEFSRIDAIKGQNGSGQIMTAVAPRRAAIEHALSSCPAGRWIAVDEFSRFMQASEQSFAVTHNPWKLYISERQYGSLGYDGSDEWRFLQGRYLAAVLFEYAATLGMVDVAFVDPSGARNDYGSLWGTDDLAFLSRYDGLREFRITPLGAYVLGLTDAYQPAAVASNLALSVLPSLQVKVVRGDIGAEETLLFENWAEPVQPGSWLLNRERALSAIEKGYDIAELRAFLQSRDDMPLPDPVEAFIRHCERNGKALKTLGSAVLIECRDNETAELIAAHKETAALCLRAGPKTLVVRSGQLSKFRERVRVLGFGMAA
jgi:hypothetical protein